MKLAALLLLVFLVSGCGTTTTKTIVVTATVLPATAQVLSLPTATPTTAASAPATAANGSYTDAATGVSIRLKNPVLDATGSGVDKPDPGNIFLLFYATVTNNGGDSTSYNPLDVQIIDQAGQTFDETTFLPDRYSPRLPCCSMPAHDKRAGWIGYQIPRTATSITVTWDDGSRIDPPATIARYSISPSPS